MRNCMKYISHCCSNVSCILLVVIVTCYIIDTVCDKLHTVAFLENNRQTIWWREKIKVVVKEKKTAWKVYLQTQGDN